MTSTHTATRPALIDRARQRRCVGRHRACERRTLHLLDVENLLGGNVSTARCQRMWLEYRATVGVDRDDQVVAAVAQHNAANAAFGLPTNIQRVLGDDGPDGADRALMDAVDIAHAATRFDRIVIGSGDHRLTSIAVEFALAGCDVAQVLGAARFVAADLYRACPTNYVLPIHRDRGAR